MSSAAPMQQAKTDAAKSEQYSNQLSTQGQQIEASEAQSEFVDLRPQATALRQLQETANLSPNNQRLKAFQQMAQNSPRATQLKAMSAMMNASTLQLGGKEGPLQKTAVGETTQREEAIAAPKPNNTGLPDNLKTGIESLSGMSMDHVKVHFNSSQPAQLNAHAYAQGSEIHVSTGQEQHLPHEAWHVVQQAQGRVKPTMQMKSGVAVNDDVGLEREADVMGAKALQRMQDESAQRITKSIEPTFKPKKYHSGTPISLFESPLNQTIPITQLRSWVENRHLQHLLANPHPVFQLTPKRKFDEDSSSEDDAMEAEDEADLSEDEASVSNKKKKIDGTINTSYWSRVSLLVTSGGVNIKASDVSLGDVTISQKRRPTAQAPNQGDHIVAWSAMQSYWERMLSNKTLIEALIHLKQWLLEDHVYEVQANNNAGTAQRLKALTIINTIENTEAPIETLMNQFEVAISMFICANQGSSFATIGTASGGNGEANAIANLNYFESKVDDEPGEFDGSYVLEMAQALLDKSKIGGNDDLIAKSVHTWVSMLKGSYPNLLAKGKFSELDDVEISQKKVSEWQAKWNALFDAKKQTYHNDNGTLKLGINEPTVMELSAHTLVQALISPTNQSQAMIYEAAEVTLSSLEIPDDRADTQFAPNQGAHTLAWTFFRQSLMRQISNTTVAVAVEILKKHCESDKATLDFDKGFPGIVATVKSNYDNIQKLLDQITGKKLSVTEWKSKVSTLIGLYIETNQKLKTTTYAGAYVPTGHGEGATNTAFNEEGYTKDTHYLLLVDRAHKFVDLGIIYKPLLEDAQNLLKDRTSKKISNDASDIGTSTTKKSKEVTRNTKSVVEDFNNITRLQRYKQPEISELLKGSDITHFDELLNMVQATKKLLEKEMNKENLVDEISNANPEQNASIKCFLDAKLPTNAAEFTSNQDNLLKRISKLHTIISNIRNTSPTVRAQAEQRQKYLMERFNAPDAYFEGLYDQQYRIIKKVIGDYWEFLPSYHLKFYDDVKSDKDSKIKIIRNIFTDPLNEKDLMIGSAIKIHLMDSYNTFMPAFLDKINTMVSEKVDELMPDQ